MELLLRCAGVLVVCWMCTAEQVTITSGTLRGTTFQTHSNRTVHAFLGIPYAKPPTQGLRFQEPRVLDSWDGIRDATKEGSRCPQLSFPENKFEGSEDCLYLNVFTPRMSCHGRQMDVIVILHAGGFTHGSGDIAMYGPDYLMDHNVVMVTANYRLGALGFLSTGDEHAPGNYGLKDQVDVLRWVHRNIPYFSGNPNRVTLFGAQAGAASVHLHMLSPLSRNLFHRAVSQSGTALSPWAHVTAESAQQRAVKLAQLAGCKKTQTSQQVVQCLRKIPAKDLVELSPRVLNSSTEYSYPFVPVDDEMVGENVKPFLHNRPIKIMENPLIGTWEIPWLVSVTSDEGLPQSLQVMVYPTLMEGLDTQPEKHILKYLGLDVQPQEKADLIAHKIWDKYFRNLTLSYATLIRLAEMTSDFNYYHGLVKSINTLVQASDVPVFMYHFSYNRRDPRISLGVPQGEDTLYMFPDTVGDTKMAVDPQHLHVTHTLLHILLMFARYGDPTPEPWDQLNDSQWPTATHDEMQYLEIGISLSVKDSFHPRRMAFWDDIFNMLEDKEETPHDEL
ncbi:hypothetical protein L9F63_021816 [Diploptera punctata]|uniref:Carboxylesterase type B domain-containing protein n=1 Tax=Diploptera punctata TaxID=6984 RepID=A0AAD8EAZ3_DIPPU|nr:hypothetical protein L9F63_021816 [Diploptera punctata]